MSRRNHREAKRARREEKARRNFEHAQHIAKANEDFEQKLREKIRKISDEYNSKLLRSSVPELRAEYKKRQAADPKLGPYSKMKKGELVAALHLGQENEDAMVERNVSLR